MGATSIILVGAGGHAVSCIDLLDSLGKYRIVGLLGLDSEIGSTLLEHPIIGSDKLIRTHVREGTNFLIAIGQIKSALPRIQMYKKIIEFGGVLPTLVSPKAYVSKYASIGTGSIIMHGAIVNAGAAVGDNCIINTNALIEHGANVGNHCHISTAAVINGGSTVKSGSFIGSGATVREGLVVGANSIIPMGENVFKSVPDNLKAKTWSE